MQKSEQALKKQVHVGVFDRMANADRAVAGLVDAGFRKEDITVICPTCTTEKYDEFTKREPSGSHAAAAATAGGAIGAVLGGLAAVIGVVASGGVGLLVAGPLLAGAGGGAVAGGLVGAMMTRGVEPEVADYYDQALTKGQILVSVNLGEHGNEQLIDKADRVFLSAGALPVELRKS
jgi:hypothetical protein